MPTKVLKLTAPIQKAWFSYFKDNIVVNQTLVFSNQVFVELQRLLETVERCDPNEKQQMSMYNQVNHSTLEARLNGIISSQYRARISFFVLLYASGAVLFGLWNMYLSWERQWAEINDTPNGWGKTKLLEEQITSWLEGQSIGISAIGLKN